MCSWGEALHYWRWCWRCWQPALVVGVVKSVMLGCGTSKQEECCPGWGCLCIKAAEQQWGQLPWVGMQLQPIIQISALLALLAPARSNLSWMQCCALCRSPGLLSRRALVEEVRSQGRFEVLAEGVDGASVRAKLEAGVEAEVRLVAGWPDNCDVVQVRASVYIAGSREVGYASRLPDQVSSRCGQGAWLLSTNEGVRGKGPFGSCRAAACCAWDSAWLAGGNFGMYK